MKLVNAAVTPRRLLLATAILVVATVYACDGKESYPVSFTCIGSGGGCSQGQACPALPLDAGGCEELPGLFGNPPTPVESGRPPGCQVGLSYGNPFYADEQQTCLCASSMSDGGAARWQCGI